MDWKTVKIREKKAGDCAAEIVEILRISSPPIDPVAIARTEAPALKLIAGDFKNRFDGLLEYHPRQDCFLLFYNTKYDPALPSGQRHPRTRFSLGHELGHFYLEKHRAYLMQRGPSHKSKSEFQSDV